MHSGHSISLFITIVVKLSNLTALPLDHEQWGIPVPQFISWVERNVWFAVINHLQICTEKNFTCHKHRQSEI